MGAFTDDGGKPTTQTDVVDISPKTYIDANDPKNAEEPKQKEEEPKGIETDVNGVMADGEHPHGSDRFPVFNVSKEEFYQNMQSGRRRLRFKSGSNVQKYMSGTKYNRPFYISYTDEKGKVYSRKVK